MRNATKNASVATPAPNILAMIRSRTNPRMRETSVMLLTVASTLRRFNFQNSGWVILTNRRISQETLIPSGKFQFWPIIRDFMAKHQKLPPLEEPMIKSSMSRIAGQIMMIVSLTMTVEVAPDLLKLPGWSHIPPDAVENLFEHGFSQAPGLGVVAAAMVAVIKSQIAWHCMNGTMAEGKIGITAA